MLLCTFNHSFCQRFPFFVYSYLGYFNFYSKRGNFFSSECFGQSGSLWVEFVARSFRMAAVSGFCHDSNAGVVTRVSSQSRKIYHPNPERTDQSEDSTKFVSNTPSPAKSKHLESSHYSRFGYEKAAIRTSRGSIICRADGLPRRQTTSLKC